MTTALCFHCGETKFGALCPCAKCGFKGTGDIGLDICFSDHSISVKSLEELGGLIKRLQAADPTVGDDVRFWAFITYVSAHPSELLKATPPAEIANEVERLLRLADLPQIDVELKEKIVDESPAKMVRVPFRLFQAYVSQFPFTLLDDVEVRIRDSEVVSAGLMDHAGEGTLIVEDGQQFDSTDIVAIRRKKKGFLGWLTANRWVTVS